MKGKKTLFVIIVILLLGTVLGAGYYFFDKVKREQSSTRMQAGKIKNPTEGLSLEEAIAKFDESFVNYLLYNLGASKLHNPPFSSDLPKIEFYIGEDVYHAKVVDGFIEVGKGEIDDEDINIITSVEEAVKMVQDSDYITDSFKTGKSSIELKEGEFELYTKGYLDIYERLKEE